LFGKQGKHLTQFHLRDFNFMHKNCQKLWWLQFGHMLIGVMKTSVLWKKWGTSMFRKI